MPDPSLPVAILGGHHLCIMPLICHYPYIALITHDKFTKVHINPCRTPLNAYHNGNREGYGVRYGGRLALQGQMDFGELSSAVLVAQGAFDGARLGLGPAS